MSFAYKISSWNRRRKWRLFLDKLKPQSGDNVLDVGFTEKEYSETDNFLEKNYPYQSKISALGVDEPKEFLRRYPHVKAVRYDGAEFPFSDLSFDTCWSNAVLEHVGGRAQQIKFLREIKRVGRRAFITTPNKFFPFEVHTRVPFLHWLPKNIFDKFLRLIGKPWATGNYMHLVSEKELRALLDHAGINNYKIIRNRLFGFTLDFVVIF